MRERRAGSVLVIDDQQHLCGTPVPTLAEGQDAAVTNLAQARTLDPITITPDSRAIDALRRMGNGGFRHLPVVENERIWGIVSRGGFKRGWRSINWTRKTTCGNAYADDTFSEERARRPEIAPR